MPKQDHPLERLGDITLPSGMLIIIDTGLLKRSGVMTSPQ